MNSELVKEALPYYLSEILKAEKNPGGLMSFLWHGKILDFYGVEEVTEAGYWQKLYARLQEIGAEIISGKLNQN